MCKCCKFSSAECVLRTASVSNPRSFSSSESVPSVASASDATSAPAHPSAECPAISVVHNVTRDKNLEVETVISAGVVMAAWCTLRLLKTQLFGKMTRVMPSRFTTHPMKMIKMYLHS